MNISISRWAIAPVADEPKPLTTGAIALRLITGEVI